jgi:DNA polymerase-1
MPERIAINTVIQGSAADLIKLAMLKVHDRLHQEGLQARMLLQIHDELLFEVPATEVPSLRDLLVEEMTSVGEMDVPLKVDLEVGENWADCRPLE